MEKKTRNLIFLAIAVLLVLIIVGTLQFDKKQFDKKPPSIPPKTQETTTVEPSKSSESLSSSTKRLIRELSVFRKLTSESLSSPTKPEYSQPTTTHSEPYNNAAIADHAKVLVWKYLGEPRYDEFTVTSIKTLVEGDMWEVRGEFAYVGQKAQPFDAIIEISSNGDSFLWGFSWE